MACNGLAKKDLLNFRTKTDSLKYFARFMQSLFANLIDPMSTSLQELIVEHTLLVLPGRESDLCSSSRLYMHQ